MLYEVITTLADTYDAMTTLRPYQLPFTPRAAFGLIMDPNTGEILAVASMPHPDPARRRDEKSSPWRLRPFTDQWEPGSTFKAVTFRITSYNVCYTKLLRLYHRNPMHAPTNAEQKMASSPTPVMNGMFVITSYSIHYTKLYEPNIINANAPNTNPT